MAILAAVAGGLKYLLRLKGRKLALAEKEVLAACANHGEIRILTVDAYGDWVRADSTDFFYPDDRARTARYLDAFHGILRRGLATHQGGFLY